jgi:hypothetical protein
MKALFVPDENGLREKSADGTCRALRANRLDRKLSL